MDLGQLPLPPADPVLRCSYCHSALRRLERTYRCDHGHAFDIARQGYVNLLPASSRRSRHPGDNREMILARRRFLEAGHFDPVAEEINQVATSALSGVASDKWPVILDAGAGEGFYLARLEQHLRRVQPGPPVCYGVDVSRYGMQFATHRSRDVTWVVASVADLPVQATSVDLLLSIFAPVAASEFRRVLRPSGRLLVAEPGPDHLAGLRRLLYADVVPHQPERLPVQLAEHFALQSESRLTYEIALATPAAIGDLLTMTPFGWNIDEGTRARAEQAGVLRTAVDVLVRLFR